MLESWLHEDFAIAILLAYDFRGGILVLVNVCPALQFMFASMVISLMRRRGVEEEKHRAANVNYYPHCFH